MSSDSRSKVRIRDLKKRRGGRAIVAITAYDATFSHIFDQCDLDVILVGDSLGMVVQGHSTTIPVTIDDMVYHCRAVTRCCPQAHVVVDMPFLAFQQSEVEAFRASTVLMQQGRAEAIKVECDASYVGRIEKIIRAGVPVMGHVGLRPQHVHAMGGYRKQGKSPSSRQQVLDDAKALQDAGCYAILVECVPNDLGAELTDTLSVPVIGIGSGPDCDGQILVSYDVLGLTAKAPSFAPTYIDLRAQSIDAVSRYANAVRDGSFGVVDRS